MCRYSLICRDVYAFASLNYYVTVDTNDVEFHLVFKNDLREVISI